MHQKSSHTNNKHTNNSHKKPSHKHYENKYFAHFKHTVKIYAYNLQILLKISINNHSLLYIRINNYPLLYIHINTHNNYNKKYTQKHPKHFTMISIKFFKKILLAYIKKAGENIMFFENDDKSCTVVGLYLNHNVFFGYKDSYNYYDIDIDKILLFKK